MSTLPPAAEPNRIATTPSSPPEAPDKPSSKRELGTRDTRRFAQQRAHDTHRALLAAAAELFAERGFDDTQTPDIARAAGVSVGTFYRYFADKRQAFVELFKQHTEEVFERVVTNLTAELFGATQTDDARWAAVGRVIDILFQTTSENPALLRVFLAVSMRDNEVARIRDDFEERGRTAVEALLREVAPGDRIEDARAAAEVIHIAAQEVAMVAMGCRGVKTRADPSAVRRALAEMLYRFVFGTEPALSHR